MTKRELITALDGIDDDTVIHVRGKPTSGYEGCWNIVDYSWEPIKFVDVLYGSGRVDLDTE